jgi:subtilisin family serine protease
MLSADPEDLSAAILDVIEAGARVINISAALVQASRRGEQSLLEALDTAARRGVIVVAAAGNDGTVGGSALTSHPWVVPVSACDRRGRPLGESNLGASIGRNGLSAPGESVTSLGTRGTPLTLGGTSAAAPFVTGAIALLRSEFPGATAAEVKYAATHPHARGRPTVVPPLLDAAAAYDVMARRRLP